MFEFWCSEVNGKGYLEFDKQKRQKTYLRGSLQFTFDDAHIYLFSTELKPQVEFFNASPWKTPLLYMFLPHHTFIFSQP